MKELFLLFNNLYSGLFSSGFALDVCVAVSVALPIVLSVVVFGRIVDGFWYLMIKLCVKFFSPKLVLFVYNRLTFPGVFLHEISHAFMIWFTGGKVTKIKLMEFSRDGRLGHVEFAVQGTKWRQMCQLAFGSSAPVFIGIVVIKTLLYYISVSSFSGPVNALLYYLVISFFMHMTMSKEDMRNYFHGMILIFPSICVLCLAYQFFCVRV